VCRAVLARPDADDAWSETFLAALRAYPGLADGANIEAWLVTIAHHKAIDIVRAQSRRATPVADVAQTRSATDALETSDDGLWAALRALLTKQTGGCLPPCGWHVVRGGCRARRRLNRRGPACRP
jgi:DNA-directed RNA polymerase specialized sigma24 family protein